jgi:hypothetical protein
MFRLFSRGPAEEKASKRLPIRLGMALIVGIGMLLGPLALAASSASATVLPHATSVQGSYVSVTPFRIVDTRTGATDPATYAGQTLAAAASLNVQVTGVGAVPAGASAAVLNVTVVDPTSSGFLTAFPEGTTMPTVSNLNFAAGVIVPNLVTVPLSAAGGVSFYNSAGTTDIVVDVEGYYTSSPAANGYGLYNSVSPVRALGTLASGTAIGAGVSTPVTVVGVAGVPSTASAVVVNVTAASSTTPSFLTVYPAGVTMPTASNLNFGIQALNVAIANRVTVGVGTAGQIDVYNHTGSVNVDVDVDGYYSGAGGTGSAFVPITPVRVADTRTASAVGTETAIAANTTEAFLLATTTPVSGIPTTATAVATNVTVVPGTQDGYLTVYPTSVTTPPVASSVNWVGNESPAVPNFTIADTAGTGSVNLYASHGAPIDVVIDAFGYFVAPTVATATVDITVPHALSGAPTASVSANGTSTVAIDATVTDGAAGPVVGNDTVLFTATPTVSGDTCGTFSSPTAVTDSSGVATDTYTAPAYSTTTAAICDISVQDSIYGQVGYGIIDNTITNTVTVTASPTSVEVGLTPIATTTVSAVVTALPGYSADNDTVSFTHTTGCGSLSATSGTTGPTDTAVSVTYTADTAVGFCTITATDTSLGSGTVTIDQTSNPPTFPPSVTFSPTSASVTVGSTNPALFTVTVANSSGGVASDPLSVAVSGTGCTGSTASLTSLSASATGTDTVNYTAGATATTCVVTVTEADADVSGSVDVTQTAVATSMTVTAAPQSVAVGGTSDITVLATSPSSTDVGGAVTFTVTPVVAGFTGCGAAPAATTLSSSYVAYATYTAGSTVGFCTLKATLADGTSGTVSITQVS